MKKITFLSTATIFILSFIFSVFDAKADFTLDPIGTPRNYLDYNHVVVIGAVIIVVAAISLIVLIKIRRKNKKNNANH